MTDTCHNKREPTFEKSEVFKGLLNLGHFGIIPHINHTDIKSDKKCIGPHQNISPAVKNVINPFKQMSRVLHVKYTQ